MDRRIVRGPAEEGRVRASALDWSSARRAMWWRGPRTCRDRRRGPAALAVLATTSVLILVEYVRPASAAPSCTLVKSGATIETGVDVTFSLGADGEFVTDANCPPIRVDNMQIRVLVRGDITVTIDENGEGGSFSRLAWFIVGNGGEPGGTVRIVADVEGERFFTSGSTVDFLQDGPIELTASGVGLRIEGSNAADVVEPSEEGPATVPATILGAGGNDVLVGGTADDLIYGGDGVDSVDGGDGFDTCLAEDVVRCRTLVLTPSRASTEDEVRVSGAEWPTGPVALYFDSDNAGLIDPIAESSAADGVLSGSFRVPAGVAAGTYRIAACQSCSTAAAAVTVLARPVVAFRPADGLAGSTHDPRLRIEPRAQRGEESVTVSGDDWAPNEEVVVSLKSSTGAASSAGPSPTGPDTSSSRSPRRTSVRAAAIRSSRARSALRPSRWSGVAR